MKQLLCLIAATSVFAGETGHLTREEGYWVETTTASVPVIIGQFRVTSVGAVIVRGGSGTGAAYTVRKRVRARTEGEAVRLFQQVTVRARPLRDTTSLTIVQPLRHPAWVDVEVQVPRGIRNTLVYTKGGNVAAYDLDGSVQLESAGGTIDLDRIGGSAVAKTGGGEIRAGIVAGALRCISAGGSMRATKVGGEVWMETAGGEIHVAESEGAVHASTAGGNIRVDRAGSYVTAHTAGGRIEVQHAGGLVNAENSGGSIEVGAAQGVRCEASGGAIRLRGTAGSLRAATDVGNILAELIAGVPFKDSVLSTGEGDVTVFIPSNFPVTVKALNEKGRPARIVSDFPEFMPAKTAMAAVTEACLNGCGPVLRISANGIIYLRRER